MISVLAYGVDAALAAGLSRRIDALSVERVDDPAEVAGSLASRDYELLLLGDVPGRALGLDVLRDLRSRGTRVPIRVACCLDRALDVGITSHTVADMGIDRVFFRPLDVEEIALQLARLLGAELLPGTSAAARKDATGSALDAVWARFREPTLARVDVIESAVVALLEERLDRDQQRMAEREAHKLAGSAGTFGFPRSSVLARSIESRLAGDVSPPDAVLLSEQVLALRADLEGPRREVQPAAAAAGAEQPRLLVLETDAAFSERLSMEAQGRGFETVATASLREARAAMAGARFAAALISARGSPHPELLAFVAELERGEPPVCTVVLADSDNFANRVEIARSGVSRLVEGSASPGRIIDAVAAVMRQAGAARAAILAVDDDPHILGALRAILDPAAFELTTLEDPLQFWAALEAAAPELIILDVDMPHVTGLELCRVVRSDPKWHDVPVLFLTSRTDVGSIQRAFAAGADDYLGKPVVASELIMRIRNRLERARLSRDLAETDALTGIANRRKSTQEMERFISLARRRSDEFSLAVLDLDHFKLVNDSFGHGAGDEVLRSVAQMLSRSLRAEDVVGRWGGEEFAVGLYGATKAEGARCLAAILASIAATEFAAPDGSRFTVTCSGGVSQLGVDGSDVDSLYRVADSALYEAKAAGRNRVVAAGVDASESAERVDVAIVEDDDALVGLLEHSLRTRGLSVRSFRDGEQASSALIGDPPDVRARVILLDVDLPGLNGLDVLRRLARGEVTKRSKVVMLTARTGESEVLEALDLGAIDHVTKPFSVPVLLQKVRVALRAAGE